jgi:hypothetical protein
MDQLNDKLAIDWLNFAKASLGSRIEHTAQETTKVLTAVQAISSELSDKKDLDALINLKTDQASTSEILDLLQDVLNHLDTQDDLAQLIAPLFSALQFEDRSRQKLESILGILTLWAEVRNSDISDENLASRLMQQVVSMEQQVILAKYFPDFIQEEAVDDSDGIDLF